MENGAETKSVEIESPHVIEEGPTLPQVLSADFVAEFEKGVANYKRWVAVCYRLTRETHWINHGTSEKPHYSLQGPGAEALMNPLGISYDKPQVTKELVEDGADHFYRYWCEGYMESRTLGRRGYYVGYCDSRDAFFNARPGWSPKTGEGDVRKSAMTNWIVNGVTRLGGLRDPDPELLITAGLDPKKISSIDYTGRKTPEADQSVISEPQLKRLWAICKGKNLSDEKLHDFIKTKFSYSSSREIRKKDYDAICKWAEAASPTPREPGQEG